MPKDNGVPRRNLAVEMRPENFHDYLGNDNVVTQIRTKLDSNRVPTAFLFSGPKGSGKTTLARCINSRLNGELVEQNAASDTGVDAARLLIDEAQHRPLMGDYKVLVLDEAHMLTKQAQNALLKAVEDSSPSTLWIFCTTEVTKLIPTLRDRCQAFALVGLKDDQVALLVYRGLQFINKKPANIEAFIKLLVQENVRSPRAILNATERFADGLDPLGAVFGSEAAPQAFDIAKAVASRNWLAASKLLAEVNGDEAMAIRAVTANYFKSMLLKGNQTPQTAEAILLLTQDIPFDGPLAMADLCAKIYRICTNGK